jgi:deoxyribose-phosphate aldolase
MNNQGELDRLVDEITRRVKDKLAVVGSSAESKIQPGCQSPEGGAACDTCRGCHVFRGDEVRKYVDFGIARIAAGVGHDRPASDIAPLIDHTLLKPDATRDELKKLCDEAKRFGFATVCVNAVNVRFCAAQLQGSSTKPIAVVGFPLGAQTPSAKGYEAREAVRNGAQEIDMVINIGALKSKDYALVLEDITAVVCASAPKPVKVILETALLNREQKIIACSLSKVGGAAFVKTSTGFGPGGATPDDIALMREVVGPDMGVKASGGVRTEDDARKMLAAGANRLGASASVSIVSGDKAQEKGKPARRVGGY